MRVRFPGIPLLALAALLAWTCGAEAGTGMTVSPSRVRLQKPVGETASQKIVISNSGTYPLRIETDAADMLIVPNEKGLSVRDEAPPATTPHSCARWIQVPGIQDLVIPPGEASEVEFVISPPPEVKSGGYGAYLFIIGRPIVPKQQDTSKTTVQMVTVPRLGISVVYEVAGTVQRKGDLLKLEVTPPSKTEPLRIFHQFKNTGNAEVVLSGSFHILDSEEVLVGKGSLRILKMFSGETGVAETLWEGDLPPGKYKAMVTLEIGPDAQQVIVRDFPLTVKS